MSAPATKEEYETRVAQNVGVTGFGEATTSIFPCPFCGAAEFLRVPLLDTYSALEKGAACSECGRSARWVVQRSGGSTAVEMVQTAGDDPPEWVPCRRLAA